MKVEFFCETNSIKMNPGTCYSLSLFEVKRPRNLNEMLGYLRSNVVVERIGVEQLNAFVDNPHIYFVLEADSQDDVPKLAQKTLEITALIINYLWFVRDVSCNVMSITGTNFGKSVNTFTIRGDQFYSNAKGLFEDELIEETDWEAAFSYLNQFKTSIRTAVPDDIKRPINEPQLTPNTYNFTNYNNISRIERALSFLHTARANSLLPAKISYYVVVLECLFSGDDSGEIQHKIAQRIANYIGFTPEDKQDVFKFVKETYKVRSKYLHGQKLSNKHDTRDKLTPMSVKLDELLRKILRKVWADQEPFLKDSEDLKVWLDDAMF